MNKKASMQLGINAIVVLIIALAILGLAMSFITGLFGTGKDKLGGIISSVDLPIHADATDPVKFDKTDIKVKSKSEDTKIVVSVYNNNNFLETDMVKLWLDCYNSAGLEEDTLEIAAPPQSILVGSEGGYGAIITSDASSGTALGTYPCRIIASVETSLTNAISDPDAVSGQIFVTVTT